MANDLTGQFDVVAEFSVGAVNRLLAAMHRSERFLHSVTFRVDDVPRHPGGVGVQPSVLASMDLFGDPTVNQNQVGGPIPASGRSPAASRLLSVLDGVVNQDITGATTAVQPSFLKGVAQLQLSPPELFLSDQTGSKVTVSMQMMSRYFPDPHTTVIPEFIHGQVRLSADVSQVASEFPNGQNMIHVDIRADTVGIDFFPQFPQNMSDADIATVVLAIRNALKTSALPTNVTVPDKVISIQFKTLPAFPQAIAVLLNVDLGFPHGGTDTASVTRIFLGGADDFAFGAGRDYVLAMFQPVADGITSTQSQQSILGAAYTIGFDTARLDLQPGKIVVTIDGNAHTNATASLGSFEFTVEQDLTLAPQGSTANLVFGDFSIKDIRKNSAVSFLVSVGQFLSGGTLNGMRDQILDSRSGPGGTGPSLRETASLTVSQALSADNNLGGFLQSLLAPAQNTVSPPEIQLAYTSIDIQPSGIVLHGSVTVADWPDPYVEFEKIPAKSRPGPGVGGALVRGPDYSALKTWIPGGRITEYDWFFQGQPASPDSDKFVRLDPGEQVALAPAAAGSGAVVSTGGFTTGTAYAPLCLTVRGMRLTASGPVAEQPVSASTCGYTTTPIINGVMASAIRSLPLVALAEPGPGGLVHVAGHTPAQVGSGNLIVHFADGKSVAHLDSLTKALQESKRTDAPAAILAVLTPEQLAKAHYRQGIIYTEDQGRAWERIFGTGSTPRTLIISPIGKEVWRHEGQLDSATLSAALVKLLVRSGSVDLDVLRSSLRLGQPPPNFLFEYAPGNGMTLRRLAGRAAVLVFWKTALQPSIQAVRDLEQVAGPAAGQGPVVLAINDGEPADVARTVAAENGFGAALVLDPQREISTAYGVTVWPTIVSLNALGLVREVRYGRPLGRARPQTGSGASPQGGSHRGRRTP